MLMSNVMQVAAFRRPKPVPLPESYLRVAAMLGLPVPSGRPTHFMPRRCKNGTDVHVFFPGGLMINFSRCQGIKLRDFSEARKWVKAWAAGFGFELSELKKREMDLRP